MDLLTIWETLEFRICQAPKVYLPGYLLVKRRLPAAEHPNLGPRESPGPEDVLKLAKSLLCTCIPSKHIHVLRFANSDTGVLFHVFPATDEVTQVLAADPSISLDDSVQVAQCMCRNYSVGRTIYGAVEILNFVAQARELCRELRSPRDLRKTPESSEYRSQGSAGH